MRTPSGHVQTVPEPAAAGQGWRSGRGPGSRLRQLPRLSGWRPGTRGGWRPATGFFRDIVGTGCSLGLTGMVTGTVTVSAASIETNNARRDTHLRSPEFFDSASRPYFTFTADEIGFAGQGVTSDRHPHGR